jgi:BMFP domain-containing protein YqiC
VNDRRGTNGMLAVLNELYAENAALKARIAQLEAALAAIYAITAAGEGYVH